MQATSIGAFAPLALLCAAFGSWSLISLLFLVAFFIVQYNVRTPAPPARPRPGLWMSVVLLATAIIVTEGLVELIWAMLGTNSVPSDSHFLDLLGLARLNPWEGSAGAFLSLVPQFAVALIAACALYQEQQQDPAARQLDWDREVPNWWANLRSFLLPTAQVLVGVARPSWIALPYFVCSCVDLLYWSVSSGHASLSWAGGLGSAAIPGLELVSCWVVLFIGIGVGVYQFDLTVRKPLLWCTGSHILLLYVAQLPISYAKCILDVADHIGLFRVSDTGFGWPEGVQAVALIAFYVLMCFSIKDLQDEQPSHGSTEGSLPRYRSGSVSSPGRHISDDSLTETLLPSQDAVSSRETIPLSRRWDSDQRRALVFQHATINFITYGFPMCLIALVCWSFVYSSLCSFGLLLYVGYIFFSFPTVHMLRRLNPILLGFILSWSLSTYVFNAAFTVITEQSQMGMEIWHSIGLWHYETPGLFIFAQFGLGVLVATDIFVSNVIMKNMSEAESPSNDDQSFTSGDQEDRKVLILAVVAWCLRRSAYVLSLGLIFFVGMKDGLLNAVYIGFFLVYLVSSAVAKRTWKHLILFCEIHFAALYLLQLDWISRILKSHEAQLKTVFLQLGLWEKGTLEDFVSIALLLCFLAVQSHGVKVLSSLSATMHQSPQPPLGWGMLTAGSGRSVLLSVYASQNFGYLQRESSNDVNWVTKNLAAIAEFIRSTYRSFGTYIAYGTVLTVICFVEPNYIALGYLCLLLVWVIGRQILGHTKAPLWYPLMIFAGLVFVFRYALTAIPALQDFTSDWFSLHKDFGFNKDSSLLGHLWDSLAILSAMQLYRFERSQVAVLVEDEDPMNDSVTVGHGVLEFIRRLIILHCGKILTLAVFYTCITPVSATGFLYLVMLIITCNMSKSSRLPAQLYSVYTGLLMVTEYLFQMWGNEADMFPGQSHGEFANWIGFRVYEKGFMGKEAGLRTKVLVLAASILQYTAFHWLEQLPSSLRTYGQFEEPCPLFLPYRYRSNISYKAAVESESGSVKAPDRIVQGGLKIGPSEFRNGGEEGILHRESSKVNDGKEKGKTPKKLTYGLPDVPSISPKTPIREGPGNTSSRDAEEFPSNPKLGSPWGSAKESRRWTKRAVLLVKQERYEAQLRSLSIYVKHHLENLYQLYGLEMCMLSLLVASFTLLNVISLFYIFVLGLCILLSRPSLRIIWPFFVISFALVLVMEYAVLGKKPPSWIVPPSLHEESIQCTDCVYSATGHSGYCWKCWLGLVVNDRQMLAAHFMVFFFASLQLRANMLAGSQRSRSVQTLIRQSDRLAWKDMSMETSGQWTWLDHARFFFFRHLLHVVLLLVFATGTLQYDVLHLGYLTFSLVLFRMRSTLMIKRNSIFRFLRLYNFMLIGASLIYQAPYFGYVSSEKCALFADMYNIAGLYKMRFGFRITARSALVDITIFCVAGLQAYVFRSREFDQVLRYLESQQVEARAHAQEDKATWKKEHLQRIRATEEQNQQRRLQVEKMKTDMVHLQLRLDVLDSTGKFNDVVAPMIELDDRGGHHPSFAPFSRPDVAGAPSIKERPTPRGIKKFPSDSNLAGLAEEAVIISPPLKVSDQPEALQHAMRRRKVPQIPDASPTKYSPRRADASPGQPEVLRQTVSSSDVYSGTVGAVHETSILSTPDGTDKRNDDQSQKQKLMSGVQMLEDGVTQVHNLGNKALANLVGLFNLEQSDRDDTESSSTDDEARSENKGDIFGSIPSSSSQDPQQARPAEEENLRLTATWRRLSILRRYFWAQINSNTDFVCYFFFVLAYIWNFSFLTLMYPAVLYLYALLANPGPSQQFWFLMLVYTEANILLQYMYQIHVQNCDGQEVSEWLQRIGIPASPMNHSFVISVLPLFLVYLTTLVQSSIKARDGEWMFVDEGRTFLSSRRVLDPERQTHYTSVKERLWKIMKSIGEAFYTVRRGLSWYWRALGSGSEAPPHFVQISLHVEKWPEDGIQPERIESQLNRLLAAVRREAFQGVVNVVEKEQCSRIRVESIENSPEKHSMALAVLEVVYAAPPQGCAVGRDHHTLTPAADVAAELQKAKDEGHAEETGFPYPIMSIIPGGKREVDLYALIFGTDLVAFLYVAVVYQSAIKHSAQLIDVYQVEDQFPKEFVFVLMTLFFLIVVDRVIYLCSFASAKVLYYFLGLGLYTSYVTAFVWGILTTDHERHFYQLLPFRGFYLIKALSLALQAVQLKYGLPHKSTLYGQFLTRKINSTSWFGFRLYRSLPFLYELRCFLDWSCTTTALTMYDWLKLEDIHASLFLVQCDIKMVREKHRLGQKQGVWIKFCSGALLFLILIGVIWAPMLIYSSGNPTNIVNKINDVRTRVEVKTGGGKFTLYETGLCQVPFLEELRQEGRSGESFDNYLLTYDPRDVQIICCEEDAESQWMVPPPTVRSLSGSIDEDFTFQIRWEFHRSRPKGKEVAFYVPDRLIEMNVTEVAEQFRRVLNGTKKSVTIPNMYPRYFRVAGSGDVRILDNTDYVSGDLTLNRDGSMWWSFQRSDADDNDVCNTAKGPMAVTVSEEVPNGLIGETLSKFSIWSLYITFVLALGRFIRLQCSDVRMRIPFENFPACDRLLAICEDIYAARAERELELEEGLFWTLIKIYRSPHILMEYTKKE